MAKLVITVDVEGPDTWRLDATQVAQELLQEIDSRYGYTADFVVNGYTAEWDYEGQHDLSVEASST